MRGVPYTHHLEAALVRHGLVPANCRLLNIVVDAHQRAVLRFEVLITQADLGRLSVAFAEAAQLQAADTEAAAVGTAPAGPARSQQEG